MDLCIQDKSKKWSRIWRIFGCVGGGNSVISYQGKISETLFANIVVCAKYDARY